MSLKYDKVAKISLEATINTLYDGWWREYNRCQSWRSSTDGSYGLAVDTNCGDYTVMINRIMAALDEIGIEYTETMMPIDDDRPDGQQAVAMVSIKKR